MGYHQIGRKYIRFVGLTSDGKGYHQIGGIIIKWKWVIIRWEKVIIRWEGKHPMVGLSSD